MRYYSSNAGAMVLQAGITAAETGLTVDQTVGLPGNTPFTLILDVGRPSEEVVTVTAVSGNILTVTRGEDGTSAQTHAPGAVVRHGMSARDLAESRRHEADSSGVHGVTGAVVGTTDTQALSNKDLTAGTNTFPATLATAANLTAETTARTSADAAHASATVAHGATGAVVGTTNVQTLSGKTLQGSLLTPAATSSAGATVRGLASQTGPLQVWQDSTSATLASVSADGTVVAPNIPSSGVAGTSTTKAGKRMHWGTFTSADVQRSDATGIQAGIAHGCGFTPTSWVASPVGLAARLIVSNVTATTFDIQCINFDNTPNGDVTFSYSVFFGE